MNDLEKAIEKEIAVAEKYITPLNNTVIVKRHETYVKILRTAPRDIQAIERMIQRKKDQISKMHNVILAEPLHHELDALEWLLSKIKLNKQTACTISDPR